MNCPFCGTEMENGIEVCPNCGAMCDGIQVLGPDIRDDFQGITVSGGEKRAAHEDGYYEYKSEGPNHRVYIRRISLGNKPGGIFQKMIVGAVLIGLVIVALPIALIIIGVFLVVWFFSALSKR